MFCPLRDSEDTSITELPCLANLNLSVSLLT